ncbi:MAG: MFS transporter [Anaerolineae bacterium]|nr:MAG: MFS transporter [Anaerolineae bacterium]
MPQQRQRIIALNYASFAILGLGGSALGPSLPTLADQMGVSLDVAGGLISGLSVGYMLGGLTAGLIIDTLGRRLVYLAALGIQALSLLGIVAVPNLAVGLAVAFLLGLGQGSTDLAGHVVTGDVVGQERGAALNRLHLFFGAGALIGPVLIGYGLEALDSLWPAFGVFAALTLLTAFGVASARLPTQSAAHESIAANARAVVGSRTFWGLAAFFYLYVGLEVGLATWTFTFLSEALGTEVTLASWATSGFFLALTAGRLVGSRLAGRQVGDERLVLLGIGGGIGGAVLLWAAGALAAVPAFVAAVLLVGFCFGPVYPTTMGVAQRRYAATIGTAVGLLTVGGSLGATSFPWLQGRLLVRGGLLWSVAATGAGTAALLAVAAAAIPRQGEERLASLRRARGNPAGVTHHREAKDAERK